MITCRLIKSEFQSKVELKGLEIMRNIQELTRLIVEFRNARDWKQFHSPKDMILSLLIEAGECAEHFQWKNDHEIQQLSPEKKQQIGHELSDILYWTLLLAEDLGIDLNQSFEEKMQINERKYPVEKSKGCKSKYTELSHSKES